MDFDRGVRPMAFEQNADLSPRRWRAVGSLFTWVWRAGYSLGVRKL
jgi:hypothetical protein